MEEAIKRLDAQRLEYAAARATLPDTDPAWALLDAKLSAIEDAITRLRA